jgi:hypothetical protein
MTFANVPPELLSMVSKQIPRIATESQADCETENVLRGETNKPENQPKLQ